MLATDLFAWVSTRVQEPGPALLLTPCSCSDTAHIPAMTSLPPPLALCFQRRHAGDACSEGMWESCWQAGRAAAHAL